MNETRSGILFREIFHALYCDSIVERQRSFNPTLGLENDWHISNLRDFVADRGSRQTDYGFDRSVCGLDFWMAAGRALAIVAYRIGYRSFANCPKFIFRKVDG